MISGYVPQQFLLTYDADFL